jgi:transposase
MAKRSFSPELKREAVRQVTELGKSFTSVARQLEITPNLLHLWKRKLEAETKGPPKGKRGSKAEEDEIKRLRREVADLREENSFLKKAAVRSTGHCNATSRVRLVDRRNDASSYTTTEREGAS